MSTLPPASAEPRRPFRIRRWFISRRARVVGVVALVALAGIVIGVTDPFATGGGSAPGVSDNSYPASTTTVIEEPLSQQTQVSATLGFSGSYAIAIPSGTAASALAEASQTAEAAAEKVSADEEELSSATSLEKVNGNSTLVSAEALVADDQATLSSAKSQLNQDERLDCPAVSAATVTTAVGASSGSPSSGSPSSGSPSSGSPSSGSPSRTTTTTPSSSPSPSGGTGDTGTPVAASARGDVEYVESVTTSPPIATTGSSSGVTSSGATVSGTVDPNGLSTSYDFEYGPTAAYGSTTPAMDAGSGDSPVSVSATVSGLIADTTYDFALVAVNAAGTTVSAPGNFQTVESSCTAERLVIIADEHAVTEANDALAGDRVGDGSTVSSDQQQLEADEASESAADQALATAQAAAANPASVITALPAVGAVIRRGQSVYSLDDQPVPLFYGAITPYRALYLGVSDGSDVTELQKNLVALGFGKAISVSPHFSPATEKALEAWQASIGVPATGDLELGDIVLEPGPIQVDSVSADVGEAVQPATAVLMASSTTRVVTLALDAAQQSEVRVGDPATITLPDNSTTPGVVSSVGAVATCPSGSSASGAGASAACSESDGSSASPTITVDVTPTDPSATGNLDQAPVEVSITTSSVPSALVVPVDALLALASGGYALETVSAGGIHHLEAVTLGLFDEADGLVQVSGAGVAPGQRIVVPNP